MFDVQLFLGFPLSPEFIEKLDQTDPLVISLFIQENEAYLQDVVYDETRYLGKYIGKIIDLPSLELMHANVYSLLKKIVPDFSYENQPLYLLPVISTFKS